MSKTPKILPTPTETGANASPSETAETTTGEFVSPEMVTVTKEELEAFAGIMHNVQEFLMSMDFRLRQIEAVLYAVGAEEAEGGELVDLDAEADAPATDEG